MKRFVRIAALAAALSVPVAGFAQAPTKPASKPGAMQGEGKEKHPEIHAAMAKLREAREILERKAANDFGGHKHQAVEAIDEALKHLNEALEFDKK